MSGPRRDREHSVSEGWPERDRRSGPDRRAATQRVIDAAKNAHIQVTGDDDGHLLEAALDELAASLGEEREEHFPADGESSRIPMVSRTPRYHCRSCGQHGDRDWSERHYDECSHSEHPAIEILKGAK